MTSLAPSTLASPRACSRCRGLVWEDVGFTAEMAIYAQPQRRFICAVGHSTYTGLVAADVAVRLPVLLPGRTSRHTCAWCEEEFEGTLRQKYCTKECTRAADTERQAQRRPVRQLYGVRLQAALRHANVTRPSGRPPTTPIPYAPRSTNLSQKWV